MTTYGMFKSVYPQQNSGVFIHWNIIKINKSYVSNQEILEIS